MRYLEYIRVLKQAVFNSLERELSQNPPLGLVPSQGDVSTCIYLVNKRAALRFHPPTCSMDFTSLLLSES